MDGQASHAASMEDLYGADKAYPEPYLAGAQWSLPVFVVTTPTGKLPNQLVHDRFKRRFNRETFLYSVRFRMGPFGLSFDNKVPRGTVVETVVKGGQAELSDIKVSRNSALSACW